MENRTNEELQKELNRLRALLVSKMSNLNNAPKNEMELFHWELQDIQNKINVIKTELDNRMLNL